MKKTDKKGLFLKKAGTLLTVIVLLMLSLACGGGGGGGSSSVVWPVLPEGSLHIYEENLPGEYLEVNAALDSVGDMWLLGFLLWWNCYSENGVIFVVEPDNPEEEVVRLSTAFHPRGMNWTSDTLSFINDPEHPENKFLILEIMKGLEGGGMAGIVGNAIKGDFYITAGGKYEPIMKENAQNMVDTYYEQIPFPMNLAISKRQFQEYLSQQIYDSAYVGGRRLGVPGVSGGFTELAAMLIEPWNWERLDFVITMDITSAYRGLMTNIVTKSSRQYRTGSLARDSRLYRGNTSPYVVIDIPDELAGREIIRTDYADRARTDADFLTFNITRPTTMYMAVDPANVGLVMWLTDNEWIQKMGESIQVKIPTAPYIFDFDLYYKEYGDDVSYPFTIVISGNGDTNSMMYSVITDAGTYPVGIDIIVSAHTALVEDNPADVVFSSPAIKSEGGIVVNLNGIEEGAATIDGKPVDLVHADFVEYCDANVFVNSEGGTYGLQNALADVTNIQFVEHILSNNGFRLIDTYNDKAPAFGGESQVLRVEKMLGYSIGGGITVPLNANMLLSFANMNLLNSPNLTGVYLKSIATDAGIQLWRDEEEHKGLNYQVIMDYIENNDATYKYFYFGTKEEETTLVALLKRIGNRAEGEQTFRILIEFNDEKRIEIVGGAFIHDYFTNIYDPIIGGAQPIPFDFPEEVL